MFLRSLGLLICSTMQLLTSPGSDWKVFLPGVGSATASPEACVGTDGAMEAMSSDSCLSLSKFQVKVQAASVVASCLDSSSIPGHSHALEAFGKKVKTAA